MCYACQGPYGYFNAKNFGKGIHDNFDSDAYLRTLVRRSITGDMRLSPSLFFEGSDPYLYRFTARNFLKEELKEKFTEFTKRFKDLEAKQDQLFQEDRTGDKYNKAFSIITEEFGEIVKDKILKELIELETESNTTTSFAPNIITYPDIISYLYSLNIYGFSKEDENNLSINSFRCSLLHERGRNVFIYTGDKHASTLIPHENTIENLFAYIKAREHEKKYSVNSNAAYLRAWG